MMQRFLHSVFILLLCGLLLNCGRAGPLYLPIVPGTPGVPPTTVQPAVAQGAA